MTAIKCDTQIECNYHSLSKIAMLVSCTAWCSEIGSLTSRDGCNSRASSDRRGPISLHQAVSGNNFVRT